MAKKIKLKEKVKQYEEQIEKLRTQSASTDIVTRTKTDEQITELWKEVSTQTKENQTLKSKAGKKTLISFGASWGGTFALTCALFYFTGIGAFLPGSIALVGLAVAGVVSLVTSSVFLIKRAKANKVYKKLKPIREKLDALKLANQDVETLARKKQLEERKNQEQQVIKDETNANIITGNGPRYTNGDLVYSQNPSDVNLDSPNLEFNLETGDNSSYIFRASYNLLNDDKKGVNKVKLINIRAKDLPTFVEKLEDIDFDSQKMRTAQQVTELVNSTMVYQCTYVEHPYDVESSKKYKDSQEYFKDLSAKRDELVIRSKKIIESQQQEEHDEEMILNI